MFIKKIPGIYASFCWIKDSNKDAVYIVEKTGEEFKLYQSSSYTYPDKVLLDTYSYETKELITSLRRIVLRKIEERNVQ